MVERSPSEELETRVHKGILGPCNILDAAHQLSKIVDSWNKRRVELSLLRRVRMGFVVRKGRPKHARTSCASPTVHNNSIGQYEILSHCATITKPYK